jgi:hypothetical protein
VKGEIVAEKWEFFGAISVDQKKKNFYCSETTVRGITAVAAPRAFLTT